MNKKVDQILGGVAAKVVNLEKPQFYCGRGWFEVLNVNVGRLALLIRPGNWEGAQNYPGTIPDEF